VIGMTDARRPAQNRQRAGLHGAKGRRHVLRIRAPAHDDDGRGMRFHDPARGLQSVKLRHVNVHRDDIRPLAPDGLDRALAVVRRSDDLDPGVRAENVNEKLAHHGQVFDYQDLDHAFLVKSRRQKAEGRRQKAEGRRQKARKQEARCDQPSTLFAVTDRRIRIIAFSFSLVLASCSRFLPSAFCFH
jgi:hypothetical protein